MKVWPFVFMGVVLVVAVSMFRDFRAVMVFLGALYLFGFCDEAVMATRKFYEKHAKRKEVAG